MSPEPNIVSYNYRIGEEELHFNINTADTAVSPADIAPGPFPAWTRLEHQQCACCPLKVENCSHCPAAIRMYEVLEKFKDYVSIQQVQLTVKTQRRTFIQNCDLQSSLNSMLGLLMATSGCPVVGQLRSMATFHIPFCSIEETLFRSVGAYLTKQYFAQQEGKEPDWELTGLKQFYDELEQLNQAFAERIRSIERSDAISNAMVIFFSTSIIVASALEENLEEYKDYFTGASALPPD